ncbi:fumarylacetoacetate hydrolase family protein [Bordetella avium]|uniref:2-hydroxyhepta-2,4-diene-1,7-dioate isomerase n=1 Tax=Bordetella avium (strain 197N) TaxID=360910 RepID=Q2KXR4_BORA1|nr:fumarylacetoacetate hydrolase family protein [Bordetella avium]AZY48170.1 FAA hydrolase family protein [Bordetella avium]AZY51550.1 FAA hydrolase family protein [Bordetella avium]RIQ14596.1 FAA hydrolase family protein [Bordetella avium]RIQ16706.1 FAA hydrolase family protein [Bordetella avium]RIQ40942.1 FAA hydrolase family protein [Bordetella avium]
MKICWFNDDRLGVVDGAFVADVSAALRALPAPAYPNRAGDLAIAHLPELRAAIEKLLSQAPFYPLDSVRLLSPVANPGKIIGVPVNYLKHVEEVAADVATFTGRETGSVLEQGLFLKANSSLIGCGEPVRISMPQRLTHHEIELAAIIGRTARNVSEQDALAYIAGYTIALDMTVRGAEDRSMRKSLDTYSVLGPWLVTADEIADPQRLGLRLSVNGADRQVANTSEMILHIAEQIAWASRFYTLEPGDVIMTGTCDGVGPVVAGDVMHAEIEGIGAMTVSVAA